MAVEHQSPGWRSLPGRCLDLLGAWQPFTGRGIAAFAGVSWWHLLMFQTLFAGFIVLGFVWSLRQVVFPVVHTALAALPDGPASIQNGFFDWPGSGAELLAASPRFALVADPGATGALGINGDLQLELARTHAVFRGVLGTLTLPYPPSLELPLDRGTAPAVWGAWRTPGLALIAIGGFLALMSSWWVVALLHALPAWILGWLLRRELSLGGAIRIAAAALLPAALIPAAGILLYATLWLRAPGFAAVWILHWPAGWVWLAWGIVHRPAADRARSDTAVNPFTNRPATPDRGGTRRKNPFSR